MSGSTFDTGATIIALRPFQALAGRSFEPGDVIPWRQMDLGDRLMRQLHDQRRIGPLTRANYAAALRQRTDGASVARGHTFDGLVALGILEPDDKNVSAPPGTWKAPEDAELYLDQFWLCPQKRSNFTFYEVHDLNGGRLNPGGLIRSKTLATELCDRFLEEKARIAAADGEGLSESAGSATSTGQAGGEDDGGDLGSNSR